MIIDINAQLGQPWGTRIGQTAEELLTKMDKAGIDRALVSTFPFGNYDNDYVAASVRAYPDRLSGVAMLSPFANDTAAESLARYVDDAGFVGARLHPAAHGYKLSEKEVCADILGGLDARGLPVIAYSGDELYATPFQLMMAALEYTTLPFVMLHSGFMMQTNDAVMVAERCPNVYLEHSSGISMGITQSLEAVGAGRILFGSDSPYMDIEVEKYKIEITVEDQDARERIFFRNAQELFKL